MKNEQQSQNLSLKVDLRSTFHNNFVEPTTNVFAAQQVDHLVKNAKHQPKLAMKQCCATS